jgi:TonB family protein
MRDRVADVLAQREALDRGAGTAIALSVLLHGGLVALAIYAAMHASAPQPATFVSIKFAPVATAAPRAAASRKPRTETPAPVATPRVEEVKPRIEEPKPVVTPPKAPVKPEKNIVPFSPFGQSTKKGSEIATPAPAPAPAPSLAPGTTSTADVPVGGSGVTGLEGGDFPYPIYIQSMNRKVGGAWARPKVTPGTATIVYFRIHRDGRIVDAVVETPSGNGTFDRAALSAVLSASPLNPLPFGYSGPYLGVRLTFK